MVAADPGLDRFRMALRATLTAALVTLLLGALARAFHQPGTTIFVAVMIAMLGVVAVSDAEQRAQRVTLLLVPLPAALALVLGSLAAPHHVLSLLALLAVTFIAVVVRRFGPRGLALGLLGFMAYFTAIFFRLEPGQLPWALATIVIAVGVAYGLRFGVVRETPQRVFGLRLRALHARVAVLLAQLADALDSPGPAPAARWRIRRTLSLINEGALVLEDAAAGTPALQRELYELELSATALVEACRALVDDRPGDVELRHAVARLLHALRSGLHRPRGASTERLARVLGNGVADPATPRRLVPPLEAGLELLTAARRTGLEADDFRPRPPEAAEPAAPGPRAKGLHPTTRQGIQVALATGLAMVAGTWLSPQRFYWAVIAAFVVFNRATTLGETLQRATHRVLGTVVGVVAGLALAELLLGHLRLEIAAIFALIFLAYYFLQSSYGLMIFFFTGVIAIFYGVLGRLTPGVLYLRIEETLLGAAIGVLVSALVFPAHTRRKVQEELGRVLAAFAEVLPELAQPRSGAPLRGRELDRRVSDLRSAARPLLNRVGSVRLPELAALVHDVLSLAYYARLLASGAGGAPRAGAPERLSASARILAEAIGDARPGLATRVARTLDDGELPGPWARMDQLLGRIAGRVAHSG